MELDDGHGDGGDQKMISASHLEKKKEKNKTRWKSRQMYCQSFGFGDQDTIESVITFRIDNRTIKGESFSYLVS
jgi:hypothetical protein